MPKCFAGLDIGDKATAISIVGARGGKLFEGEVETTPTAVIRALAPFRPLLERVGFESGLKANWLHKALLRRRFPVVCLDARRTHAALSGQRNKTDTLDARGIALLLRSGHYDPVYVRSDDASQLRALLTLRKAVVNKLRDLESVVRSTLKEAGLSVLPRRVYELKLPAGLRHTLLARALDSSLRAAIAMRAEVDLLTELVEKHAQRDPVCKRMMTVPGVGPMTAATFMAGVDTPTRFASSRTVAVYFGLTPRRHQSGATSYSGRISHRGDPLVRTALYSAAHSLINTSKSECALRKWALKLKETKGRGKATVALARGSQSCCTGCG